MFPGCSHVHYHNLTEEDDRKIWEFAKEQEFRIVTQDADFTEFSRLLGSPPKVIWLRCGNMPTIEVEKLLIFASEAIDEFINSLASECLEIY